ncbi:MAG: SpiroCoCo family coiled-coil protein, partial [Alkalispirochaeta sp.]
KETKAAVEQLAKLDETLSDVEHRMKELQTAREWLARTETRLEEIRRDAGEQVKLLGSIMREESKKNPDGSGGAPSLSARETVQKLAHQGWKVDEIARATKVSRGEVELILELTGKK